MSHTGKWVEAQIRTKRMDEIAELGYAAHWKYKAYGKNAGKTKESKTDEFLRSIREMQQQNPDMSALEFIDLFRKNFHKEEVFVFTPKGKLIHLALGATVLDFAFEIHSEIGMKCLGAKVNGKLVPLGYELHNGDQVEILTSKQAKPSNDWLHYAKSPKALSKIRECLRSERRLIIEKGKEDLAQKFAQAKLTWDETTQTQYRLYLNYKNNNNVFYEAGLGHISLKDVESFKKYIERKEAKEEEKARKREESGKEKERDRDKVAKKAKNDVIVIGDKTGIDYSFAKCCNPVFGDDVFGFITIHEGIKIHRNDCPNAVNMRANYGYRITKAVWQAKQEEQFITEIKFIGNDRMGIVRDVTQMISNDMQVNIAGLNIGVADSNIFEGHIKVYVRDIQHLYGLMERLKSIEGIEKVTRYDTEDNWDELNS
jgi:GTP pyrophosphokinase